MIKWSNVLFSGLYDLLFVDYDSSIANTLVDTGLPMVLVICTTNSSAINYCLNADNIIYNNHRTQQRYRRRPEDPNYLCIRVYVIIIVIIICVLNEIFVITQTWTSPQRGNTMRHTCTREIVLNSNRRRSTDNLLRIATDNNYIM